MFDLCGRRRRGGGPSGRRGSGRRLEGPRCGGDGRTNRKILRKSFGKKQKVLSTESRLMRDYKNVVPAGVGFGARQLK